MQAIVLSENPDIIGLKHQTWVNQDTFLRGGKTNTFNRAVPTDEAPTLDWQEREAVAIRQHLYAKHGGINSRDIHRALRTAGFGTLEHAKRVLKSADAKLKIRAEMGLE